VLLQIRESGRILGDLANGIRHSDNLLNMHRNSTNHGRRSSPLVEPDLGWNLEEERWCSAYAAIQPVLFSGYRRVDARPEFHLDRYLLTNRQDSSPCHSGHTIST